MLSKREMVAVLNKFSPFELHNTFLLVGALLPVVEEARERASNLNRISTQQLGLRPVEIRSAVAVLAAIHLRIYPKPEKGLGVAAVHIPIPKYTPAGLEAFGHIPLSVLYDELKKREGVYRDEKPLLRITKTGFIYLLDKEKPECPLTPAELKYLEFFLSRKEPASLKQIGQGLNVTQSNASRDIKVINQKAKVRLKIPYRLIGRGVVGRFFLNRERYSFEPAT